ncbi:MAG: hypothetical protein ACO3N7_04850 [Kiritimatiellia bacterium]
MDHDIFFDCPQCSHTLKVSSSLIGVLVECPECVRSFKVPDVRDGLHPRLRRKSLLLTSTNGDERLDDRLERLKEGFSDLRNQQKELLHGLKFLDENARIILKQVKLIAAPQLTPPPQGTGMIPRSEPSLTENADIWLRWSRIFGWLTLGISLGIGILYLKNL